MVRPACGGANAELSCALPICPRRRRRREQIVGADKIACITSHFVPVIQAILQLNSALEALKYDWTREKGTSHSRR